MRLAEVNYYTEARESSHILILDTKAKRELGAAEAFFGEAASIVIVLMVCSPSLHFTLNRKPPAIPLLERQ